MRSTTTVAHTFVRFATTHVTNMEKWEKEFMLRREALEQARSFVNCCNDSHEDEILYDENDLITIAQQFYEFLKGEK